MELAKLKEKYDKLLTVVASLKEEASSLKAEQGQHEKERKILFDTILDFETPKEPKKPKENPKPIVVVKRGKKVHRQSDQTCAADIGGRTCKMKALVGIKYCWHHAALDPNSDFIFCAFTDSGGKRCQITIMKGTDSDYCSYHSGKKRAAEDGEGEEKASKRQKTNSGEAKPKPSIAQSATTSTTPTKSSTIALSPKSPLQTSGCTTNAPAALNPIVTPPKPIPAAVTSAINPTSPSLISRIQSPVYNGISIGIPGNSGRRGPGIPAVSPSQLQNLNFLGVPSSVTGPRTPHQQKQFPLHQSPQQHQPQQEQKTS